MGPRPPRATNGGKEGNFRLNRPTQRARELRNDPTTAEDLLWSKLRKSRLAGLTFTRQLPVAGYFGDFGCRRVRLIVELDGSQHVEHAEADVERTRRIEAEGYQVIRFWNNDLTSNMDGVLEVILAAAIARGWRAPTPQPPPASVRGSRSRATRTPRRKNEQHATGASPPASARGPRGGRPPATGDASEAES